MELKYVHKLSIGGIDRSLQLKLEDIHKFFKEYTKILAANKINPKDSPLTIAKKQINITKQVNKIIAYIIYKSLFNTKKRFFFFKAKPFSSPKKMLSAILKEEYDAFASFIADSILNDSSEKTDVKKKAKDLK